MEDNFRNVLIILSAIVITGIFIHGLWTIRKQKNPYKLKASKNKVDPITRDFDKKGFDQDGVSQVKVTKNESLLSPQETHNYRKELSRSQTIQQRDVFAVREETRTDTSSTEQENDSVQDNTLDSSIESDWFKDETEEKSRVVTQDKTLQNMNNSEFTKDELGDELIPVTQAPIETIKKESVKPKKAVHIEPLYAQPVSRAKPDRALINKVTNRASKAELKRDQIEIDFDNQPNVEPIKPKKVKTQLDPQVIILSVVMPANQQMFGAVLLPSLLTLGLKYGEMNIFHRHQDNAGHGKVTFSLANIMNPGSFDLDSMETFATRGVSLFMTLPNAGDSFSVFEQMLNAAKQLAQEFNAQVLDDKRNVMTKQTEQHYVSKIREFDRMSRIANME